MTYLHRSFLAGLVGVAVLWSSADAADKDDQRFTSMFNGRDFTGWKLFLGRKGADPEKTWSVKDGVIVCTGQPNGYFYTEKTYQNYVLRYDWRYQRPEALADEEKFMGNSGCLVHIQPPHKVWPKCVEVQGMNRDHGKIIPVAGAKLLGKAEFDADTLKRVRKPVGEWNTTEITTQDGNIVAKVNGTEISQGKCDLTEGQIGFQSEGAEIHFRNNKIKDRTAWEKYTIPA